MSNPWQEQLGRRFARFATERIVAHPSAWRAFRAPLRWQFDRLAAGWEQRIGPEGLAPLEAAVDRIPRATRILDVGTGTGKAARVAAAQYPAATIVGVDLSPEMIDQARTVLPSKFSERVQFEVADSAQLPFADASFDLVILQNMIPFFPELARVTAPEGSLVLAFSSGTTTPIFVAPEVLREHLEPLGFEEFEELRAGTGTAFIARRRA